MPTAVLLVPLTRWLAMAIGEPALPTAVL